MIDTKRITIAFLAVLMAALVATSMPVVAVSGITVSITDNTEGATTDWTVSGDVETSGTIQEIYIDSGGGGDFQSLDTGNTVVTIGGTEVTDLSDVSGDGTDAVTITLGSGQTVSGGDTVEVQLGTDDAIENQDQGDYTLSMEFSDGTDTFDTGTTDYSVEPPAEAPTFDSSGDLPGTITDYSADSSENVTVDVTAASDDVHLEVRDPNTSDVYAEFDNTHSGFEVVTEATDSADGEYQWTLSHDEFTPLPLEVNETRDYDLVAVHNESANHDTLTIENGMEVSQVAVTESVINDSSLGPDVTHEESGVDVPGTNRTLFESSMYEVQDTRDIDGANTTVFVTFQDSGAADEFGETEVDGLLRTATFDNGDWMWSQQAEFAAASDDTFQLTPTYLNEAGDLHPDNATYTVYHADRNQMEVNLGDRYQGEDSMEVDTTSDNVGQFTRFFVNTLGQENRISDLDVDEDSWYEFW